MHTFETLKKEYVTRNNWIEIVNVENKLVLINLDNVTSITIDEKYVYFNSEYEAQTTIFDNKYDSLVDFIDSRKVKL